MGFSPSQFGSPCEPKATVAVGLPAGRRARPLPGRRRRGMAARRLNTEQALFSEFDKALDTPGCWPANRPLAQRHEPAPSPSAAEWRRVASQRGPQAGLGMSASSGRKHRPVPSPGGGRRRLWGHGSRQPPGSGPWRRARIPAAAAVNVRAASVNVRAAAVSVRAATVNVRAAAVSVRAAAVNVRAATANVRAAAVNVRAAAVNVRAATVNVQAAAVNVRAATVNVRAETFNVRAAAVNVRAAAVNVRAAAVSVRAAAVSVRAAAVNVRAATVNVRAAAVNVRAATVSVRAAAVYVRAATAASGVSEARGRPPSPGGGPGSRPRLFVCGPNTRYSGSYAGGSCGRVHLAEGLDPGRAVAGHEPVEGRLTPSHCYANTAESWSGSRPSAG